MRVHSCLPPSSSKETNGFDGAGGKSETEVVVTSVEAVELGSELPTVATVLPVTVDDTIDIGAVKAITKCKIVFILLLFSKRYASKSRTTGAK